ncbi:DUF6064 family protein [Bradyrhizobium stylosanthis]|uniref:DUF6064 family protein n=1 Tax=Bradyrhizobium stylosanthis TaxID=1803665 RepID=UPI0007C47D69|nr:DUF6064 family protein [Bradyrhizobium stylosanthis]
MLPFSPEQFLSVFVNYNTAIWPVQVVAYLLGGLAISLLFWKVSHADRVIAGVLAAMWLWTGFAYHGIFFSPINKAAYLFGTLFILQGACLMYSGTYQNRLCFGLEFATPAWIGVALVIYAAIIYPLIGMATGHQYPETPMFGVTPCPVTIFTFGLLLLTVRPVPRWLLVVPFVWSLIGGSAAILLKVPQDWLLLVSGCIAVPVIIFRDRRAMSDVRAA